jgi:hypothetical protein
VGFLNLMDGHVTVEVICDNCGKSAEYPVPYDESGITADLDPEKLCLMAGRGWNYSKAREKAYCTNSCFVSDEIFAVAHRNNMNDREGFQKVARTWADARDAVKRWSTLWGWRMSFWIEQIK